jgi:exosortase A-associated hydrolase 1
MSFQERAFLFDCAGEQLVGIIAAPEKEHASTVGLLVIVGGPQYRAGSHRLFVLLARHLAAQGFPCMRFDYRGMGDSSGEQRIFEAVDDDIRAAIDAFLVQLPTLTGVVLWGLCDGASAACLYAPQDKRVLGTILLNPWVHTEAGQAKTMLRHYYLQRLLAPGFWKKLLAGGVSIGSSVAGVTAAIRRATGGRGNSEVEDGAAQSLPERMAQGLRRSGRPFAVLLSGDDYVAREFEDLALPQPQWAAACKDLMLAQARIENADHTLAGAEWASSAARLSAQWLALITRQSARSHALSEKPSRDSGGAVI